jgi:hypothetical protein
MQQRRPYPHIPPSADEPKTSISFVTVHFSDEVHHNILCSPCVYHPNNELIIVDNRGNCFFDNLSRAINRGVAQARNDLVAVVHEDVLLAFGWQQQFEKSLAVLEAADPDWGVLGSVGWDNDSSPTGHWSDPKRCCNTLAPHLFREVEKLDEPILVFRRSKWADLDEALPGIHFLGWEVALAANRMGRRAYAIDAPTIHKYADRHGALVHNAKESEKILHRKSLTYQAEYEVCKEYFFHKRLPDSSKPDTADPASGSDGDSIRRAGMRLARPIVLLARGGSGSRLLSILARDLGVFLGAHTNPSGDCMDLVMPLYKGIIRKYRCRAPWQRQRIVPELRAAAARMIGPEASAAGPWGFKLPESLLLLPEILEAFPAARFIHLRREPEETCLRRTHMTARLDNEIGRIAVPLAYDHFGRARESIPTDSPAEHMAWTTLHQLEMVRIYTERLEDRYLEIRFEDLLHDPAETRGKVARWLGFPVIGQDLEKAVDPQRASNPRVIYPAEVAHRVRSILSAHTRPE